jgi:HlyD family secretion protein
MMVSHSAGLFGWPAQRLITSDEDDVKKLLFILLLAGVGLTAAAYWYSPGSRNSGEEGYSLAAVERGTLVESVSATGILQPREVTPVGSQVSGEVIKIYPEADYNHFVEKNQPLVQLDDRLAKQKLDTAKVAVEMAKSAVAAAQDQRDAAQKNYERLKALAKEKVGSKGLADQAELQWKAAQDAVELAQLKVKAAENEQRTAQLGLDLTTIRAPSAGRIIERKVVHGQMVAPPASAQLFTLASNFSRMQVNAQVAEGDISKVRVGLPVTFTVYAYSDSNETFEGKVESIRDVPTSLGTSTPSAGGAVFYGTIIDAANRRDPNSKDGKDWMLRPGMTATVEIRRRVHDDVWKMPAAAISFVLDEYYLTPQAKQKQAQWQKRSDRDDWKPVWVFKDKKPWPIYVRIGGKTAAGETGISDGQFYEVLEWDPDIEPRPVTSAPASIPQVIIAAPPAHKPGLFEQNKLKLS